MAVGTLILGETGTGKSHSLQYLDSKETYIINCVNKPLPFKGSKSKYNSKNKNYYSTLNHEKIAEIIKGVSDNRPEIKYIVVDDLQYVMGHEFMLKADETGYTKFTHLAMHMYHIVNPQAMLELRDDLNIVFLSHSEETRDGTKDKTVGKLFDNVVTLEGLFTVVLHTIVEPTGGNSKPNYYFLTNTDGFHVAKSPEGMFEKQKVENNLKKVTEAINSYYE